MIESRTEPQGTPVYQLFMLALCVIALIGIVMQNAAAADPEVVRILDYADLLICIAFFIDFSISMWRAPDRWRYFITWGWLDLLSSIPTLDAARWGRLARLARILRILRGIRAARMVAAVVMRARRESTILATMLLALLLLVGSSTAILYAERAETSNIKSAEDALWWAFTTITTVGYGDRFPVTTEGRVIAVVLMTAGVGLFGAFSATLAAWILAQNDSGNNAEAAALREEIATLRAAVEQLAAAKEKSAIESPP